VSLRRQSHGDSVPASEDPELLAGATRVADLPNQTPEHLSLTLRSLGRSGATLRVEVDRTNTLSSPGPALNAPRRIGRCGRLSAPSRLPRLRRLRGLQRDLWRAVASGDHLTSTESLLRVCRRSLTTAKEVEPASWWMLRRAKVSCRYRSQCRPGTGTAPGSVVQLPEPRCQA
jgi:hypothetical protein